MGKKTAKALRGKGPLELILHSAIGDRSEALKREAWFKSLSKIEKENIVETGVLPNTIDENA